MPSNKEIGRCWKGLIFKRCPDFITLFHLILAFLATFFKNLRLSGTSRIDQRIIFKI
jgi:hypothetical protein